jgi:hypothetical protein
MRCEDARARLSDGAPNEGEQRDHVHACDACREEFGFLDALRASRPQPPAALRERVMASFPRRRFRWAVAAWAASAAIALGAGFAAGQSLAPPSRVELVRVERVVTSPPSDEQVAVMAIALATQYRGAVEVEFEGTTCRKIRAMRKLCEITCCPIIREMDRIAKARPGLVELH